MTIAAVATGWESYIAIGGFDSGWGAGVATPSNPPYVPVVQAVTLNQGNNFAAGIVGTAYRSTGGELIDTYIHAGAVTWAISTVSTMPPGLTLSPTLSTGNTVLITGTPTQAGVWTVRIRADYQAAGTYRDFTLTVYASGSGPATLTASNNSIANATVGVATTFTPVTATLTNPGSFSATMTYYADGLPAGATLNQSTGLVSATFTVAGTVNFKIRVLCASVSQTKDVLCSMNVLAAAATPSLNVTANTIANATENVAHTFTPVTASVSDPGANDTTLIYSFANRGVLPSTATINSATGSITATTGIPSYLGIVSFIVRVRCASINQQRDVTCQYNVVAAGNPSPPTPPTPVVPNDPPSAQFLVNWTPLPNAVINVAYAQVIGIGTAGASSGIGTFAFSERGNLPSGFSLSTSGTLTGTLTTEGDYAFTVYVTYSNSPTIFKNLTLRCGASNGSGGGGGSTPAPVIATYDSDTVTDWYLIHIAQDDGSGKIAPVQDDTGSVNYDTGEIYFPPEMLFTNKKWSSSRTGGTGEWNEETNSDVFASGGRVSIAYRPALVEPSTVIETLPVQPLIFSLTPYTSDSIVPNTVRFTIGSTVYEDNEGVIQHTVNGTTGVGTVAGTINYGTGEVNLTNWVAGSSTFTLQSLALFKGNFTETEMYFNIPSAPLRNSSFTLSVTALDGTLLSATADSNQDLIGTGILGTIDSEYGLCSVRFGASVLDSSLTTEEKAEEWYDAGDVVGGYIWKPRKVILATARYNTVAYTSIPLSADVLGIDPVRLPSNGKVPALLKGQLVLVHHTTGQSIGATLSSDQVFNCGRTRLYRATISGANGVRLSPEYYTVNRELGTVTMKPSAIVTTGLTTPFWLEHTIADLCVISDNDLSGWMTMTRPLSHTFPMTESKVSGVLYIGTLQARVTTLFEQSTWGVIEGGTEWHDVVKGSSPALAAFNDAQYPIAVTNAGAYPDRYVIKFTSSTNFIVAGENLGTIGIGDTSTNCSPLNSLTGIPYFTLDYRAWGSNWANGNALRFNIISASYPVDLARSIQPSAPSGLDVDSVELLLIGNVDA